ncbi:MAG TPA: hypothetical protein VFL59_14580 [Candidatus Nanopelagicales bacterium]|nr:hypothetical protein [Candidatus Nanopelagicales bacterium]
MSDGASDHQLHQAPDPHRRRASYLYGLIVSGAVLAAAYESHRISRVIIALLGTLIIYWASETYVHWIAARELLKRDLTATERRHLLLDGWPLVTACAVPVIVLTVEALLKVEDARAVDVALAVNALLLLLVGYRMSKQSELTGWRLAVSTAAAGLLGVAIILIKTLMK